MVSGDLGHVVALPQGDIAHFNPTTVFVGKQTTLHAHPSNPAAAARFFTSYHPSTGGEPCPPDQPECQQGMVYVVYAN
jgi:hypothetical protein